MMIDFGEIQVLVGQVFQEGENLFLAELSLLEAIERLFETFQGHWVCWESPCSARTARRLSLILF